MTTATAVDFSQPQMLDESANLAGESVGGEFDLNDPNLLAGEIETNSGADPYATPPPINDGFYKIKLKQIEVNRPDGSKALWTAKKGKDGKPFAWCALEGTVDAPGTQYDGQKVWDRFVSTMTQRNGGVPMAWVLKCLGVTLPANTSIQTLVDLFQKALASEPMIDIETSWEGGLDEASRQLFKDNSVKEPRVIGQTRFPQVDGKHVPDMVYKHPTMGEVNLHAQARIVGYFPAGTKSAGKK